MNAVQGSMWHLLWYSIILPEVLPVVWKHKLDTFNCFLIKVWSLQRFFILCDAAVLELIHNVMVFKTCFHLCFQVKDWSPLPTSVPSLSIILFLSWFSVHIIMSGRQISTMAIAGSSVYLLTRKDSLCYNRLISLPPRILILSQLKIETIIAFGKGGQFYHSPPPHKTAEWPWQVQSAECCLWRMTNGAFIAYYCVISPPQCLLSVGEMDVHHVSVYLCF